MYLKSDNLYIAVVECMILNNTAEGLIGDKQALGGGVALHSRNDYVSFIETLFHNNSATRGGAIGFYDANKFAYLYKCSFVGNEVSINGGGIYLIFNNTDILFEECQFRENSAEYGKCCLKIMLNARYTCAIIILAMLNFFVRWSNSILDGSL